MKGQLTTEFLLSFLMVVVIVGLLSSALNEYYQSVKTEKTIIEKRASLEHEAFSETIMQAGLSKYDRTDRERIRGEGNIFRRSKVNTNDTFTYKLFNDDSDIKDCINSKNEQVPCTTN